MSYTLSIIKRGHENFVIKNIRTHRFVREEGASGDGRVMRFFSMESADQLVRAMEEAEAKRITHATEEGQ